MKKVEKTPPPKALSEKERLSRRKKDSQVIREGGDLKDTLRLILNMPHCERPKCECGAVVGLSVHDSRLWCPNCLWTEIEQLRAEILEMGPQE